MDSKFVFVISLLVLSTSVEAASFGEFGKLPSERSTLMSWNVSYPDYFWQTQPQDNTIPIDLSELKTDLWATKGVANMTSADKNKNKIQKYQVKPELPARRKSLAEHEWPSSLSDVLASESNSDSALKSHLLDYMSRISHHPYDDGCFHLETEKLLGEYEPAWMHQSDLLSQQDQLDGSYYPQAVGSHQLDSSYRAYSPRHYPRHNRRLHATDSLQLLQQGIYGHYGSQPFDYPTSLELLMKLNRHKQLSKMAWVHFGGWKHALLRYLALYHMTKNLAYARKRTKMDHFAKLIRYIWHKILLVKTMKGQHPHHRNPYGSSLAVGTINKQSG